MCNNTPDLLQLLVAADAPTSSDIAWERFVEQADDLLESVIRRTNCSYARASVINDDAHMRARNRLVKNVRGRQFENTCALVAYICLAARSAAIDARRRDESQQRRARKSPRRRGGSCDDPRTRIETTEYVQKIFAAVKARDQRWHDVLRLCYIEGLSHEEVGRALGVARSTVSVALCRARAFVLKRFGDVANER